MFSKIGLRKKLFISITMVVVITLGVISAIVSYRSTEIAKEDAFALADEISAKYSYQIKSELQAVRVTSESIMTVFKTLIERGEANREMFNEIQQNALRQKQYMVSFCVAFEPNKLDGKDAEYAGQFPLYDETGRYAPYWNLVDGVMDVRPLTDFYSEWYDGAKRTKQEYITDPFFFEVQGEKVLMSSLVFPVIIDGEFIGIVSSDMTLDNLQEMVSQVNTSGLGEYTEIYSNSGVVVAHPDNRYFNKNIYATSVQNMLLTEPGKAKKALEIANDYFDRLDDPSLQDQTVLANDEAAAEQHAAAVAEYETAKAFVENLKAFDSNPADASLDLTLLTNNMAKEILALDAGRLRIAQDATAAIANGESYVVTEDGYYKVYTPVHFSEATNPWSVAVSVPISEVLQKSDSIRNYVIVVSLIGFAFIALLLYAITRNLTRPILNLADSAKQIGEGNFNPAIPQNKSRDEVGILSAAFIKMVEQINNLIGELTQNSIELEKKNKHLGELNEMLVEAKDEAEASNRAKTLFLSNMSHEMRTPLNAIVGMTTIGHKAEDEAKKQDAFKKIEDAAGHLIALVNNVLDMSKMEADKFELYPVRFSLTKTLEQAIELIHIQLNHKGQTLHREIDEAIPPVLVGDDFRLSQVMINLLSNAVKFTGEGGNIGLKAFIKEQDNDILTLQFEVSDTGIGISDEQQKRLFHMFEQADNSSSRSFGGTGLGLALSKRIVEMMGGEIWVQSEPDHGSTFYFMVRLGIGSGSLESLQTGNQSTFKGKRILLAEDVEINREIVLAMLENLEITIDCAANGKEACELFSANPDGYDLVLMDVQMPVMDGVEATRQIRLLNQTVPIIALTANVFKDDVDKYLGVGMNNHLGKPLDYSLIMEMLYRYIAI